MRFKLLKDFKIMKEIHTYFSGVLDFFSASSLEMLDFMFFTALVCLCCIYPFKIYSMYIFLLFFIFSKLNP